MGYIYGSEIGTMPWHRFAEGDKLGSTGEWHLGLVEFAGDFFCAVPGLWLLWKRGLGRSWLSVRPSQLRMLGAGLPCLKIRELNAKPDPLINSFLFKVQY